jgi:fatty-acyl-CoA synthase
MAEQRMAIRSLADIEALETRPYEEAVEPRHILDLFRLAAERHGNRTAITYLPSGDPAAAPLHWSYRDLFGGIGRAANLFRALGVAEDEAVALLLPNIPETHLALWGAEAAARACPINYMLQPDHIAELIERARAKVLVALGPDPALDIWSKVPSILAKAPSVKHVFHVGDAPRNGGRDGTKSRDFSAAVAEMPERFERALGRGTVAAYFHTGGTTGAPKLAQHTHGNQVHTSWSAGHFYDLSADDVLINGFPLFHVAGSFVFGTSAFLRGANVILPTRLGMRSTAFVRNYWRFVEKYRVSLLVTVPTVIATLLNTPRDGADLSSVRILYTGGTPLPTELAAEFERATGKPVRNIFGMTESAGLVSIAPVHAPRVPNSVGWRLPYTQVKAVKLGADGESFAGDCKAGETGVLVLKGPHVGPGYTDPKRNKGMFRSDGWLISGDLGHVDADGRIFITGRAKDLIIRGGHNIDPAMIEEIAAEHPALQIAAAVGEPDAYAGELPLLFAVPKPGAQPSEREVLDYLAERIHERPALPKRVVFLEAMPVTAVGKIYKPALRRLATERRIAEALAAGGVDARVEGVEEGGAISVRIHVAGDRARIEAEIAKLLRDYAVEREIVFPLALGRGGRG